MLGVKRLALPTMLLLAFRIGQPANGFFDVFVPICLLITMTILRSSRPFMPEILLLEQCPIRSDSESVITMARRSKSLHSPVASDLAGRFFAVSTILAWSALSVFYTTYWARGLILSHWEIDPFVFLFILPASLWAVAGLSVIVRLLGYLDTRIRLEGWEVELAIRAEAMRQFGEEAGWVNVPDQQTGKNRGATTAAGATGAIGAVTSSDDRSPTAGASTCNRRLG